MAALTADSESGGRGRGVKGCQRDQEVVTKELGPGGVPDGSSFWFG